MPCTICVRVSATPHFVGVQLVPDGAFNWSSILVLGFGGILSYACECKDWETSIKHPLSCSESGCEDCSETSQVSGGGTPGHSSLQVAFTGGRSLATLNNYFV